MSPSILADLSSAMGENISTETMKCLNQKSACLQVDLNNSRLLLDSFTREGNVRETARLACVSQAKSHVLTIKCKNSPFLLIPFGPSELWLFPVT